MDTRNIATQLTKRAVACYKQITWENAIISCHSRLYIAATSLAIGSSAWAHLKEKSDDKASAIEIISIAAIPICSALDLLYLRISLKREIPESFGGQLNANVDAINRLNTQEKQDLQILADEKLSSTQTRSKNAICFELSLCVALVLFIALMHYYMSTNSESSNERRTTKHSWLLAIETLFYLAEAYIYQHYSQKLTEDINECIEKFETFKLSNDTISALVAGYLRSIAPHNSPTANQVIQEPDDAILAEEEYVENSDDEEEDMEEYVVSSDDEEQHLQETNLNTGQTIAIPATLFTRRTGNNLPRAKNASDLTLEDFDEERNDAKNDNNKTYDY